MLPSPVLAQVDEENILQRAENAIDQQHFSAAVTLLQAALQKNPQLDKARYQLAYVRYLSKKNELALSELAKIKTDPEARQMALLLRGQILSEEKRWQAVYDLWKDTAADNPDVQSLRAYALAEALEGLEQPSSWLEYLSLQPMPAMQIFARFASDRVVAKEQDRALNDCATMTLLQNRRDYQLMCQAHVYLAAGEQDNALIAVRDALAIKGDNRDARELLKKLQDNRP